MCTPFSPYITRIIISITTSIINAQLYRGINFLRSIMVTQITSSGSLSRSRALMKDFVYGSERPRKLYTAGRREAFKERLRMVYLLLAGSAVLKRHRSVRLSDSSFLECPAMVLKAESWKENKFLRCRLCVSLILVGCFTMIIFARVFNERYLMQQLTKIQ